MDWSEHTFSIVERPEPPSTISQLRGQQERRLPAAAAGAGRGPCQQVGWMSDGGVRLLQSELARAINALHTVSTTATGLPMNSVQLSNHTGYGVCKGDVLQGEQLLTLVSVGYR